MALSVLATGCSQRDKPEAAADSTPPLPAELTALQEHKVARYQLQEETQFTSHFWSILIDQPIDQVDSMLAGELAASGSWEDGDYDFSLARADQSSIYIQLIDGDFTAEDGYQFVPGTTGRLTTVVVNESVRH